MLTFLGIVGGMMVGFAVGHRWPRTYRTVAQRPVAAGTGSVTCGSTVVTIGHGWDDETPKSRAERFARIAKDNR